MSGASGSRLRRTSQRGKKESAPIAAKSRRRPAVSSPKRRIEAAPM